MRTVKEFWGWRWNSVNFTFPCFYLAILKQIILMCTLVGRAVSKNALSEAVTFSLAFRRSAAHGIVLKKFLPYARMLYDRRASCTEHLPFESKTFFWRLILLKLYSIPQLIGSFLLAYCSCSCVEVMLSFTQTHMLYAHWASNFNFFQSKLKVPF